MIPKQKRKRDPKRPISKWTATMNKFENVERRIIFEMMNDEIAVENGMHFELFLVDEINSKKSIHFNRVKMMLFLKQSLLSCAKSIFL
jgi:hypothetical protein